MIRDFLRTIRLPWRPALRICFGAVSIALAVFFFRHDGHDLLAIRNNIVRASPRWLALGLIITAVYVLLQAAMYVYSYRAVAAPITWGEATVLFLRRNLLSVFLPAGGVTSLAFYTGELEARGVGRTTSHFASTVYSLAGLLTVFIVAAPTLCYLFLVHGLSVDEVYSFTALAVLLVAVFLLWRALAQRGRMVRLLLKLDPALGSLLEELREGHVVRREVLLVIAASLAIELVGILHLYIAIRAMGMGSHWEAAAIGYLMYVLILVVSPFLRGLGAIEVSLVFVLVQYRVEQAYAVSAMLIYRLFEFWVPLVLGVLTFMRSRYNIVLRLIPVLLTFLLGVVNIVSAASPALDQRLRVLRDLLPSEAIQTSAIATLIAGLLLLILCRALLRGLRSAWWLVLGLSLFSIVGHLVKGIDYEEAGMAAFTAGTLLYTRRSYTLPTDTRWRRLGLTVFASVLLSALIYGVLGFYFLDAEHFGIDFTLQQAVSSTIACLLLFGQDGLLPLTSFGHEFMLSLYVAGGLSLGFGIFGMVQRMRGTPDHTSDESARARELVARCGRSALDHFKTLPDKRLFFTEGLDGFAAYKVAGQYAMVLEEPVAVSDAVREALIKAFDRHCADSALKPVYYRVDEQRIPALRAMNKHALLIGQEALVDVKTFSLDGKEHKDLRNSLNRAEREHLRTVVHRPPLKDGLVQKLKAVSDEWLATGKQEAGFSQGWFDEEALRMCTVLTVETAGEKVLAFLNMVPDPAPGEATYDLIRAIADAPGPVVDFLLLKCIEHVKALGYTALNLGLVPMSGIAQPHNLPERTLKFAYERIAAFGHYKGLRSFKEKFSPTWHNKYLIYDHDFELFSIPAALQRAERVRS